MNEHKPLPQPLESIVQFVALPMLAAIAFVCVLVVNIGSLLLLPLIAVLQSLGDHVRMPIANAERGEPTGRQ